jgi:hypothetical protein
MGARQASRLLASLDRVAGKPGSLAEAAASVMRLNPGWSDDDIGEGLHLDPALVAQIRGNLAAGRPPQHGLPASVSSAPTDVPQSPSHRPPRRNPRLWNRPLRAV